LSNFTANDVYDYLDYLYYLDDYTFIQNGVKKKYSESTKSRNQMQIRKFLKFINPELANLIKVKKNISQLFS